VETKRFYVREMRASFEDLKDTVREILAYYGEAVGALSEPSFTELKVVLNELLVNAVKHGSNEDDRKHIEVICGVAGGDCALVVVSDEGGGPFAMFREKRQRDSDGEAGGGSAGGEGGEEPAGQVSGIPESGRGIFIVRNLCDDFMVNARGNRVMVCKRLEKS